MTSPYDGRPTGRTMWDRHKPGLEFFRVEHIYGTPPNEWSYWDMSELWICRLLPFLPVEVRNDTRLVKWFWRRSSARAYVEVLHKLGVVKCS